MAISLSIIFIYILDLGLQNSREIVKKKIVSNGNNFLSLSPFSLFLCLLNYCSLGFIKFQQAHTLLSEPRLTWRPFAYSKQKYHQGRGNYTIFSNIYIYIYFESRDYVN